MQAMLDVDEHHWWYRGRRRIIRAELDRLPLGPGACLLDAGCGSGRTLAGTAGATARCSGSSSIPARRRSRARAAASMFASAASSSSPGTTPHSTSSPASMSSSTRRMTAKPCANSDASASRAGWLLVTVPAYQALWSLHDEANHHYRRYSRTIADGGGARGRLAGHAHDLVQQPAAAPRGRGPARRSAGAAPHGNYTPELKRGPAWLNGLRSSGRSLLEAHWLSGGRTLPAGLSLLAVLENAGPRA